MRPDSMNQWQHKLYEDLISLTTNNEAFYFVDQSLPDQRNCEVYRIFLYRLASYTEFLLPNAMECRGHTFLVNRNTGDPISLVSLPFPKFFNLNENSMTMGLDLTNYSKISVKVDGSMISTYMHHDKQIGTIEIKLKSKGSLHSTQATEAMALLDTEPKFKKELMDMASCNCTVTMEYISPTNRIVIAYNEPKLVVLGVRENRTGEFLDRDYLRRTGYTELSSHWVEEYKACTETDKLIDDIVLGKVQRNIEGFVIELDCETRVKIKREEYLVLHRAKDSINAPRRLYEAVLEGTTDDLKSLFAADPAVIESIRVMEERVREIYSNTVAIVEGYYNANFQLDRKEYAIKGQQELSRMYFGLAMMMYLGKDVNYPEFLRKHWREFDIKDIEDDTDEETGRHVKK